MPSSQLVIYEESPAVHCFGCLSDTWSCLKAKRCLASSRVPAGARRLPRQRPRSSRQGEGERRAAIGNPCGVRSNEPLAAVTGRRPICSGIEVAQVAWIQLPGRPSGAYTRSTFPEPSALRGFLAKASGREESQWSTRISVRIGVRPISVSASPMGSAPCDSGSCAHLSSRRV